jgi:UDP-sulfoquinovose synthase
LYFLQYKDRVKMELIKPAVDWRKSPVTVATMQAAVAQK